MNPITHLLVSWTGTEAWRLSREDARRAAWAGLLPDLDGLGLVVDVGNRLLGRPETMLYGTWHHALLHGLPGALVLAAAVAAFSTARLRTFLVSLGLVHLHLLCDLVGSRGPDRDDVWTVPYLAPLSDRLTLSVPWQWPVNGWPNVALTLLLLAAGFVSAARRGRSPVSLLGERADRVFVETVRRRWRPDRLSSPGARRCSTPSSRPPSCSS